MRFAFFCLLFLVLTGTVSLAQILSGQVTDQETGEALEFVNVGVLNRNIGTVTDEQGNFSLPLSPKNDADTLRISLIGYEPASFIVRSYRQNFAQKPVTLRKAFTQLPEVQVVPKTYRKKILGNDFKNTMVTLRFVSNALGTEIGTVMKVGKRPAFIEEVRFNIALNTHDSVTFRVNLYHMRDGKPAEAMLTRPVLVTTREKDGTFSVDLREHNLVAEDDFLVTLEWLKDLGKGGLEFGAGLLPRNSFARLTSQGTWEKVPAAVGFSAEVMMEK